MSDLQCPARVLVVCHGPGGLPDAGATVAELAGERLAAVLSPDAPVSTAVATEIAALAAPSAPTGVPLRPLEPLDDVADTYRGEAVAVVIPAAGLAGLLADIVVPQRDAADGEILALEGDSDGWRWVTPGGPVVGQETE